MNFVAAHPFADSDPAAELIELANAFEPVQDGPTSRKSMRRFSTRSKPAATSASVSSMQSNAAGSSRGSSARSAANAAPFSGVVVS
jgi:hypothetical protein